MQVAQEHAAHQVRTGTNRRSDAAAKLAAIIKERGLRTADAAAEIGVKAWGLYDYVTGRRVPGPGVRTRIRAWSGGTIRDEDWPEQAPHTPKTWTPPKPGFATIAISKPKPPPPPPDTPGLAKGAGDRNEECVRYDACLTAFCTRNRDSVMAHCPDGCRWFAPVDRAAESRHAAMSRREAV